MMNDTHFFEPAVFGAIPCRTGAGSWRCPTPSQTRPEE